MGMGQYKTYMGPGEGKKELQFEPMYVHKPYIQRTQIGRPWTFNMAKLNTEADRSRRRYVDMAPRRHAGAL